MDSKTQRLVPHVQVSHSAPWRTCCGFPGCVTAAVSGGGLTTRAAIAPSLASTAEAPRST